MTQRLLLGFDYGTKRIGVAVGQTLTGTTTPLKPLAVHHGIPDWNSLDRLIKEWQPTGLVVGMPFHMDGTIQAITLAAKDFAKALAERFSLPVFEMDERLSTVTARAQLFETGGYKALTRQSIDCAAASLILTDWLNHYSTTHE